jgi:hypothetical protein
MRKLLSALLCALSLTAAAEPPPYAMAATPEATAVRQHALNRCRAQASGTMREQINCSLAAHRGYAVATHLRDMALFRTYAAALRQAADDSDAQRITPYEAQTRIVRAGVTFRATVDKSYEDWRRRNPVPPGPLFDRAAYPAALKTRDAAVKACGGWTAPAVITARTQCIRKAERSFAAAIGLTDMDLYHGYDSVLTFTAADAQDGRMTPANLGLRHGEIWRDFLNTLAYRARP